MGLHAAQGFLQLMPLIPRDGLQAHHDSVLD